NGYESRVSPTNPPGSHPGGLANTDDPLGVVHRLSLSSAASWRCMGGHGSSTSTGKPAEIRPASDTRALQDARPICDSSGHDICR
ncbi:hypothetical protein, partial [Isoptericola haloaureus]